MAPTRQPLALYLSSDFHGRDTAPGAPGRGLWPPRRSARLRAFHGSVLPAASGRAAYEGSMRPGETLGPYRVEGKLGEGGMGAVFRARDPRLDRPVAVKLLLDESAGDPSRRERFLL